MVGCIEVVKVNFFIPPEIQAKFCGVRNIFNISTATITEGGMLDTFFDYMIIIQCSALTANNVIHKQQKFFRGWLLNRNSKRISPPLTELFF